MIHRHLLDLRQHRYARSLHHLHRSAPRPSVIVVVEDVADLWALERAGAINARYHVLGGVLSPLDGVGPDDLAIASLVERVAAGGVAEVILAVNATVEGQTTAHYVTDRLAGVSRPHSRASPTACRSAASSTISTTARSPPPSAAAPRSDGLTASLPAQASRFALTSRTCGNQA